MKKVLLSLLLLTSLSAIKTNAQMAAAQQVKYDIVKNADIDMEADSLWQIFNNNELMKKASNGYISAIEVVDTNMPVSRKVVLSNGNSRIENITQNEPHNKFIVIQFSDSALPKGIKSAMMSVVLKAKDSKTNITWRALVKGDGEAKKALIAQLTSEFDSYVAGLDKMTKKSIPAMRMNLN